MNTNFIFIFQLFSPNISDIQVCYFSNIIQLGIKKMSQHNFHPSKLIALGQFTLCSHQVLGKGATGIVYRGYRNQCKTPVAIKAIDLKTISDQATRSLLENQKNALRTVQSDHVVKLHDILQQNNFCYIITELCEGSTLKDFIQEREKLTEDEAMGIFRKILIGCNAITQNCIIHRDLKPANILISKQTNPLIIDFGYCQIIRAKKVMKTFNVGSPSYMSPQAYLRTLYSEKSDSWSVGMILYEMIHGKTLDEGMNIKQFYQLIKNNPNYVLDNICGGLNGNVKQIIEKSLKYTPEDRMSISGMKYLCDVFHMKKRQHSAGRQNTNHVSNNPIRPFYSNQTPMNGSKPQFQTLQNISNDCQPTKPLKDGFISFADFTKINAQTGGSFSHRYNKSSQVSLNSSSNKASSIQYQNIPPKFNQNTQFRVPVNIIPFDIKKESTIGAYQCLSSKDIDRRPKGPPVFRQVTVRYL